MARNKDAFTATTHSVQSQLLSHASLTQQPQQGTTADWNTETCSCLVFQYQREHTHTHSSFLPAISLLSFISTVTSLYLLDSQSQPLLSPFLLLFCSSLSLVLLFFLPKRPLYFAIPFVLLHIHVGVLVVV